jgi:hypothetical protein
MKTMDNESKAKFFYQWLGERFKSFEIASENAPISFLAKDHEEKEYYVYTEIAKEESVKEREYTGIKIANTHLYHLYAMVSQGSNVFWFTSFSDGYMLFYINDCLTPEQLKVTEEYTMIGISSALHVEMSQSRINVVPTTSVPPPPVNSVVLPKLQKVTGSFSFN